VLERACHLALAAGRALFLMDDDLLHLGSPPGGRRPPPRSFIKLRRRIASS
jgi:hypothetical protein